MNFDKSATEPGKHTPSNRLQPSQQEDKIKVTTQFTKSIYLKILKYRRDKGLSHDQDVIRLAVAYWTEKNGL